MTDTNASLSIGEYAINFKERLNLHKVLWLTHDEAATYLCVSKNKITQACIAKQLCYVQTAKGKVFCRYWLDDYMYLVSEKCETERPITEGVNHTLPPDEKAGEETATDLPDEKGTDENTDFEPKKERIKLLTKKKKRKKNKK